MKVVIFAGGFGTRLAEETNTIPKPMVRIGKIPILEHIMEYYYRYGYSDFLILTGYKKEVINDYFTKECGKKLNLKIDNQNKRSDYEHDWRVTLIDTGLHSTTAERLFLVKDLIEDTFFLTYGDGLSNVNINNLLKFHNENSLLGTVTAVHPPARFGLLKIKDDKVINFIEKGQSESDFINGGYFVFEKEIFKHFDELTKSFEDTVLTRLAQKNELAAFKHLGFWQPMDTLREKNELNYLYKNDLAPWIHNTIED
jgi:glucose-1-phosphate cytidylyltransferase